MARTAFDEKGTFVPVGAHTQNALGAALITLTAPDDANAVLIQARAADINYTQDGSTSPTAALGFTLQTDEPPVLIDLRRAPRSLKFYGTGAGSVLEYQFGVI